MSTHFSKFRGIKPNMARKTDIAQQYMKQMIVREQVDKKKNLHPRVKQKWNTMTQEPEEFKYKLHPIDVVKENQNNIYKAPK